MRDATNDDPIARPQGATLAFTWVERSCQFAAAVAIAAMLAIVGTDIVSRALFNFSFEMSDELGGYLLAAIAFLGMSVCQASGSFHHVEFLRGRLGPAGRLRLDIAFDALSLVAALVLLWQFTRLEAQSFATGDRAPTHLAVAYWMPQAAMLLGMTAFAVTLARTLLMRLRRAGLMRLRRPGTP